MADRFTVIPEDGDGWRVDAGSDVVFVAHGVSSEKNGREATITPVLQGTSHVSDRVKLANERSRQKYLDGLRGKTNVLIPADADKALDAIRKAVTKAEASARTEPVAEPRGAVSQATRLIELVHEAGVELFHTAEHDAYMTVPINGHRETYPLKSKFTRDWLSKAFYDDTRRAPNSSALADAIGTLSGEANFDGPEESVYVRLAQHEDAIYLDIGDPTWRAVKITAGGWAIVENSPVRFRRPRGLRPLAPPQHGGTIEDLRPYLNVAHEDDFILVVTWLVAALRPMGPYAVLNITGEQGSAKSTTARFLRSLVDPNLSLLRSAPRENQDLMIAATNTHVCAFDNLSKMPKWLSDAVCRLATGGGFSTRQLYTDNDETLIEAMRPVLVTGITDIAVEGDLSDRTINVTLPVIADGQRQTERELWDKFAVDRARILGALLTAVSTAQRCLPDTHLSEPPRMADFAQWGVAAETAWPWGAGRFLDAFTANRRGLVEVSLEGNHLADLAHEIAPWEGTSSDLLKRLNLKVPENTRPRDWYTKPRHVSDELWRLAPLLRRVGIDVSRADRTAKKRLIRIDRRANPAAFVTNRDAELAKNGRNDADDAHDAEIPTFTAGVGPDRDVFRLRAMMPGSKAVTGHRERF